MRLKLFVASNGIGEEDSESRRLLTNAPGSSLNCPSANWIPGFFDLLMRQQDYFPYSACPLHFRCLVIPLTAQPVRRSSPPMLLGSVLPPLRCFRRIMWVI